MTKQDQMTKHEGLLILSMTDNHNFFNALSVEASASISKFSKHVQEKYLEKD